MDLTDFNRSLALDQPPLRISVYLKSLWYDAKGNWKSAHEIIQEVDGEKAALIHAYLHRKEGDLSNAKYWYNRAKIPMSTETISTEWEWLVKKFLC